MKKWKRFSIVLGLGLILSGCWNNDEHTIVDAINENSASSIVSLFDQDSGLDQSKAQSFIDRTKSAYGDIDTTVIALADPGSLVSSIRSGETWSSANEFGIKDEKGEKGGLRVYYCGLIMKKVCGIEVYKK